ncbi:unnamed protein product [Macrosiphum euphorbiae]|uniref:Uncharacterized protein n=1 Tax=Macrosiphum euphorbiae TaxID=13131 RepID=A0AAV0VL65_9HEMI|nr:unnamed protein product [Macrosiphum euphorbiae]
MTLCKRVTEEKRATHSLSLTCDVASKLVRVFGPISLTSGSRDDRIGSKNITGHSHSGNVRNGGPFQYNLFVIASDGNKP